MKFLMINCEKATYLCSMEEEGRLKLAERVKLRMHLAMCKLCKRFRQQTRFISGKLKQAPAEGSLSPAAREKIMQMIDAGK